ncbi:MAG: hypothetical protein ACXWLR_01130, partial [Myxococcales bacterium]
MGGFYTSLHVLLGDGMAPDAVVRSVSAAVVAPGSVAPVTDGAEPDQTVLISPLREDTPWLTL